MTEIKGMIELSYGESDVLFQQASPSLGVYIILSGAIDLWHEEEGDARRKIASLHDGALLGETSVFDDTLHSVTAIASKPTKAIFIDAITFKKNFDNPLTRFVVTTLAARLRSSYGATDNKPGQAFHAYASYAEPVIVGQSPEILKSIPTPFEIKQFPFEIGCNFEADTVARNQGHLYLPIPPNPDPFLPYLEISRRDKGYIVKDLGTHDGLVINGHHIRKYSAKAVAPLVVGSNHIVIPASTLHKTEELMFEIYVPFQGHT
ncbi:cyclic nucleotide-binding domain-containing protein [Kordiimonas sp. SCSIO 12610]|uniref:cyclic nucleotide-binding domain-containing protein n=1 Tax=Kordiimonas sp. SCSIO 12610 TaxID=2829597 RepID=UPI00210BF839|nr:cyclic nucleotide-binding domain-containing protein [Kordiimonas sp. SCSIO 12610]UTW56711.1 cyclic nucleotide-binding domain-containing protein [Kordiimonas sp. SCSIO 12610]